MLESSHNFYSMIQSSDNILIQKQDLGKSKPGIYSLPPPDFSYGKNTGEDDEGAADLISKWKSHHGSRKLKSEKDFRLLNSLSVGNGLSTATEFRTYRKGKDVRIRTGQHTSKLNHNLSNPEYTYGLPLRNSTPIKAVMSNFYGRLSLESLHDCYAKTPLLKTNKIRSTKAFELLKTARVNSSPKRSQFKMKKFQKVSSRTNCWAEPRKPKLNSN